MSLKDWAEREVALACKRENPEWDGESFDYGCSCYMSALKAYKSLLEDEHSGFSFAMTRNILKRLMHNLPLTPITEADFDGVDNTISYSDEELRRDGLKSHKQCPRMSSLFQIVKMDGTVEYNDVERTVAIENEDDSSCCSCSVASNLVDEMFPITLPYWPSVNKYIVHLEWADEGRAAAVSHIITPTFERVEINRYWMMYGNRRVEIYRDKYEVIKQMEKENEK